MIDALIAGKLHGACTERTAQSGKRFVVGKLRAAQDGADVLFVSLIGFRDSVKAALLALEDGDALSVAGALTIGIWTGADGIAHPQVQCRVDAVLSVYAIEHKRRAIRGEATGKINQFDTRKGADVKMRKQPIAKPAPAAALADDNLDDAFYGST
ncbi:single-stranded DNA-binding protein [Paraburkholderia sp. SIMBA_049]